MYTTATINLDDLIVNPENFRFETLNDQQEAINRMLEEQGGKLFNLAQHILKQGLNPGDRIQVCPSTHDKKKYIVLEGNRRVITLKLLDNPEIIIGSTFSAIKKKFQTLRNENTSSLIKELECVVYDSPDEVYEWIKLKHGGQAEGVGTVDWNAQQYQRFQEKAEGKSTIALQAINYLEKSSTISSDIKSKLPKLPITNLDRLLSDPDVRSFLGIEIDNGILKSDIDTAELTKGLNQVAADLLTPNFNVGKIYTKEDRKDYIQKFPLNNKPDLSKKSDKPWALIEAQPKASLKKTPPTPKERKKLIPKSCVFTIDNSKVEDIYRELQKLDVTRYKNAVAVTFRVFIELSLDCYMEANSIDKLPSSGKGFKSLKDKVFDVTDHLINIKAADKDVCKGIRAAVANKNDLLGIDTWHAYVHNPHYSPTPQNLIITWDNVQKFMEILWGNIT